VLAELFQWRGEVSASLSDWPASEKQHVGTGLSGLLLYLVRMADVCGVDLGRAALDKLAHPEAL
jgi:dCTP diphosphatase